MSDLIQNKSPKVYQSNQFVNARYQMSTGQHRMVKMVLAEIERTDIHFKPYRIKLRDYKRYVNSKHNVSFKELKEIAEGLLEKQYEMPSENEKRREKGGWIKGNFFSRIEYVPEHEAFDVVLDTKLEEYFLNLKGNYTWYLLQYGMKPKSFYSQRLYEILKQHEYKKKVELEIKDLRETLCTEDKYPNYADFKRFVLLQGKKEMDKYCDVTFVTPFQEIKEGKRVTSIILEIVQNHKVISKASALLDSYEPTSLENELREYGLSSKQTNEIMAKRTSNEIREILTYVTSKHTQGKINSNLTGYLWKILNSDSSMGKTELEIQKEKKSESAIEKQQKLTSKLQKEQELIKNLTNKFNNFYESELIPYRKKLEKDTTSVEWQEFEVFAENYLFVCKDIIVNDAINTESGHYTMILDSFIATKIGSYNERFLKWASKVHGYYLAEDSKTPTKYRIESEQGVLV